MAIYNWGVAFTCHMLLDFVLEDPFLKYCCFDTRYHYANLTGLELGIDKGTHPALYVCFSVAPGIELKYLAVSLACGISLNLLSKGSFTQAS